MTPGGARIASAIASATAAGRPAVAAFLTAGFPSRASFPGLLRETASCADLIEVGVPFSDPMADGLTIQRASRKALADGTTLSSILAALREEAPETAPPVLLMSYVNPLMAYGFPLLARDAVASGVSGFIVPDLPIEEQGRLSAELRTAGLALVQMVTPTTPETRLARLAAATDGFLYAVTMRGTTGGRIEAQGELVDYLLRVRSVSPHPVLAGFGVRTPEDIAAVAPPADGVVVGSALLSAIERGESPRAFLAGLLNGSSLTKGARS